jgi:hypothetical protein
MGSRRTLLSCEEYPSGYYMFQPDILHQVIGSSEAIFHIVKRPPWRDDTLFHTSHSRLDQFFETDFRDRLKSIWFDQFSTTGKTTTVLHDAYQFYKP